MLTKKDLVKSPTPEWFVFEMELPAEDSHIKIVDGNLTVNETDYDVSMVRMDRPPEGMNMVPWKIRMGPFKDHADRQWVEDALINTGLSISMASRQQED